MNTLRGILSTRRGLLAGGGGVAVLVLLVVVIVLSGRTPEQPAAADPVAPSPTPTAATPTPDPEPDPDPTPVGVGALTGAPVFDDAALARPVVGVKIENSAMARPQSGLELADIVYEELVEGGATRFLALYHSASPANVGPIRSARPEDGPLFAPFDGFLFTSGGRRETIERLRASGVAWTDEDPRAMYRERSRRSPHNLFATGDALFAFAAERAGAAVGLPWRFDPTPPGAAVACVAPCEVDPGASIDVAMSRASRTTFTYDEDDGVYRRLQNGEPHLVTGEGRIGADNVVVLGMRVGDGGCCDTAGGRYTATEIVGQGRGVVLRDGRRYEIGWSKPSVGAHVTFTGVDGRPFALKPGTTWILLAPSSALP